MNEHPLPGQTLGYITDQGLTDGYGGPRSKMKHVSDIDDANVISSLVAKSKEVHRPVLDIDMPMVLHESSTPGHFHLMIDHFMAWEDYERLLRALANAGIIEQRYLEQCIRHKESCVRLPWVKKADDPTEIAPTRPGVSR